MVQREKHIIKDTHTLRVRERVTERQTEMLNYKYTELVRKIECYRERNAQT